MSSSVPASTQAPSRARPARADVVAAVVVWLGVLLALVAKIGWGGWGILLLLYWWPLSVVLPIVAAWVVARPLLGLGTVHKVLGYAPRRYRVLAWVIGLGMLVCYGAMPDGGDVGETRSALSSLLGSSFAPAWLGEVLWYLLMAVLATAAGAVVWYAVDRARLGNRAARLA